MTELFAPSVSITQTKRRRFLWAAWWSAPPARVPFQKPDASGGGLASFEEALAEAKAKAERELVVIDPLWARAWIRIIRDEDPWPSKASREPTVKRVAPVENPDSIWTTLGIGRDASLEDLKAAYRQRALEVHPDQGGTVEAFRRLVSAYEEAQRRIKRPKSNRASRQR